MSQPNNLPTLNQYLKPSEGQPPKMAPGYSTIPDPIIPQHPQHHQPSYGNWNQGYYNNYNNFSNEIYNLRNQYGMQIPDNQIDQTLDAAKANKRMYAFPDPQKAYIRYDEKGKSYVYSSHSFSWAHKDNPQFFNDKKDPDSYDGTTAYLIKVC